MIRDILNASRLQTQGNNEPCSNFSLSALLTELCEPYRLIAEAKGVKFKIELSSDAFVYLPEGQLKKAISNILSNAVNYTEAGQSILVVFDKNKLSVSNECSVLPPEQLQHIFEPFYRPDLAHSQATGGNGLGLYIVQTILDKLRLKYQFVPMPNDRGILKWTDTNYVCPFCIGFVSGRIFKTPVHRHFDGILRDAPYPFCLPLL